ncbi:MAG: type I restriction endonuclease [Candidatus Competibacteraceae bacterium]
MNKIQWERDLVERPFCRQLERMGWQWIEADPDLPETTERAGSREVLLEGRLATALKKLNLRDGQPWLDETRIARAIRDLEQAPGHRLMEINQSATELLLEGIVTDGLPDWDRGRPQPLRYIDFENPANNDFLANRPRRAPNGFCARPRRISSLPCSRSIRTQPGARAARRSP